MAGRGLADRKQLTKYPVVRRRVGGFMVHRGSRGTREEVGSDLVSQEPVDRLSDKFASGRQEKGDVLCDSVSD